jgi:hypothetical protein
VKLKVVFSVFLLFSFSFMPFLDVTGQGIKDVRINEVLINTIDTNQKTIHGGWFELFNSGDSAVNIAGCYFSNDLLNPSKYTIPDLGELSFLHSGAYIVFYACNNTVSDSTRLNFTLNDISVLRNGKGYIAFFDSVDTALIDCVTYDIALQKPGISFGIDENEGIDTLSWKVFINPTPAAKNISIVPEKKDSGRGMLVTLGVLTVVIILYMISRRIGKSKSGNNGSKESENEIVEKNAVSSVAPPSGSDGSAVNDEIVAAIAMALHLYNNDSSVHETEQTGFRLDKTHIKNSSWSNKMFTLRKLPIIK